LGFPSNPEIPFLSFDIETFRNFCKPPIRRYPTKGNICRHVEVKGGINAGQKEPNSAKCRCYLSKKERSEVEHMRAALPPLCTLVKEVSLLYFVQRS